MMMTFESNKFVFKGSFEQRHIPKAAGFRWDPSAKKWWTTDYLTASKIDPVLIDRLAAIQLELESHKVKKSLEASTASDAEINVLSPNGLHYLPYQKAGIAYAMARQNCLVGDEMGLGKTIQAIGVCNASPDAKNILIICPASLKLNWKREFLKWDVHSRTVIVAPNEDWKHPGVLIINYDMVKKFKNFIQSIQWDILIADECHYLKNPKALRTQMILGGGKGENKQPPIPAKRKVFLTGTPIINRPIELWPLVRALDPEGLGASWKKYVFRYCDAEQTRFGIDLKGASNLQELQTRLRASIMVRRMKADVLKELPQKRRQVIVLEPSKQAVNAVKSELQAFERSKALIESARVRMELSKASENEEDYKEAIANLRQATSAAFEQIAKERHKVAMAKLPQALDFIEDLLEDGKLVVFAHHKDVIAGICEKFQKAVKVTGEDSVEARQAAVDAFQSDPECPLFVGSIRAAGVGLTLTKSSRVLFLELDWTPGAMSQAEDRCHRIGQTDPVTVQHLVLDGSLDQTIAETLIRKQEIIEKALNGGGAVEALNQPIIAVQAEESCATESTTKDEITREALLIPQEEIDLVHKVLKHIAALDLDKAQQANGIGFNQMDSGIGHSLADAPRLTAKQAALGKRILKKYWRQYGQQFGTL